MGRKRIGVILSEAESYYQERLLKGVMTKAFQLDYDVLIFTSFVKVSFLKAVSVGEMQIYDAINYDKLDGVIVLADTLKMPGLFDKICRDIDEKCHVPVVFIDGSYKDYESIYTRDEIPFMQLTEHLIEVHGCRKILFLSGPLETATTRERLAGYKRALEKHGIEYDPDFVCFDGGFWYDKAAEVANNIIYGRRKKPDAIVCCGDYMAIGVVHEYQKNGLSVPEDMIVAGYDAIDEAVHCVPAITSCSPPIFETGVNAVMTIEARIKGVEPQGLIEDGGKVEIGASCGCHEDYSYTKRDLLSSQNKMNYHDFLDSNMTDIMACSKDPDDLMARIQYFLYLIIGHERYYLCLNEDCLGEHEIVGEISTVPKEYTENMVLYIRNVDGKSRTLHDPFELKEIFPDLDEERESPRAFFITPVHFIDRCYGYAVLSYGDEIKSIDITYRNWTNHVSNALESMRIRNSIANLAVRDAMTGVYSRIGVEKNIQFVIDRMSDPKNKAFIAVCDLDCLKKINDNFGHNSGDIAIKAIADAVLASTKNHEICARVGGDEFVVIGCNDYNDNYPERFSARVNDRLRVYNKFAGNEFEVSVSIGGICKHITDVHELEDMFTQADKIMYASKLERHKNRK